MREELFKIIKTRIDKLCDETTQHVLEKLKEGELQHKDLNFYLHNGVSDYLNEAIDELDILHNSH